MKTATDVEELESLIVQLHGMYNEISQLAKKSPNDGLNAFKLRLVNKIISTANNILPKNYKPFSDFNQFDSDDMPTNSDVTLIITQYIEQTERFRSDNVIQTGYESFAYILNGKASNIPAKEPTQIGGAKK